MKKLLLFLLIFLFPISVKAIALPVDITNMSIKELQHAKKEGYITYELLVKAYLDRIEKYNKKYNAFIFINKNAVKEAKKLDKEYKKIGLRSNLMGIPIALKDNIDYIGLPTTNGTLALKNSYPKKNADVTQKLLDSGAIIIGKTNMSEFALEASSSRSSYGHVFNAYNLEYTPYGSSGGTAVAVAASLAAAGIGTDTNSSIRTPSSANNVVGIRPTYNLVSTKGVISYDKTRDTVGPITKYIEDNAIILSIINNKNKKYLTTKLQDYSKFKIGLITTLMNEDKSTIEPLSDTYSEIIKLMNKSVDVFKKKNITVLNIDDFYSEKKHELVTNSYSGITLCYEFNKYIKNTNSKYKSFNELLLSKEYTQDIKGYNEYCYKDYLKTKEYKKKQKRKIEYKKYIDSVFKRYDVDVVIYPTTKNKLIKINRVTIDKLKTNSYVIAPVINYPSINVPIGFDRDNLAYGMEILSKKGEEDKIYKLSYLYEKETNYYKLPSISPVTYKYSKDVKILINNYENKKLKKYYDLNIKTKDFLKNYSSDKNRIETVKKINNEYNQISKKLFKINIGIEKNRIKIIKERIIKIIISYIIIIVFMLYFLKKTKTKRKKKKVLKLFSRINILYLFITIIYLLYEYIL